MNANLYVHELRRNLKRLLIWTGTVVALNVFTIGMYDSFAGSADSMKLFLEVYPEGLMKAFGMDAASWSNILGFYTTYFIFYILLSGGIFAVTFGMDIIAKEENRRTGEFLYTRPLTRAEAYTTKTAALLTHVLAFNAVNYLFAWILLLIVGGAEFSVANLTVLHTYGFLFCFMFAGIGLVVASAVRRGKTSLFAGIGIVLIMYFYDALMKTTDMYDTLGYVTPYRFVPLDVTSATYGFAAGSLAYFIGIGVVCTAAGLILFRKKDIYV